MHFFSYSTIIIINEKKDLNFISKATQRTVKKKKFYAWLQQWSQFGVKLWGTNEIRKIKVLRIKTLIVGAETVSRRSGNWLITEIANTKFWVKTFKWTVLPNFSSIKWAMQCD